MKIKDIKQPKKGYYEIKWKDLEANIFDDTRDFCAVSEDEEWCCTGVIIDAAKNLKNPNPLLRVTSVFKRKRGYKR